ncbi:MAG TPA: hypothetical protein VGM50_04785 [Gemmatimonadaceae bacterium]|jgi:hypothetical protein
MRFVQRLVIAMLVATPVFVVACGDNDAKVKVEGAKLDDAKLVRRDSARTLGPGDIRIASRDSSVEVALVGDSIVAGLGARVRNKVAVDLDTTKVSGTGLSSSIEKMVKGTVASALDHEIMFPISDVSDVRSQDGRLVFYDKDGKQMNMFNSNKHNDDSKTFSPADADAFVAAFKARKGTHVS